MKGTNKNVKINISILKINSIKRRDLIIKVVEIKGGTNNE